MKTIKIANCHLHGDYEAKVISVLGTSITMECPKCKEERIRFENKQEESRLLMVEQERFSMWINRANIPAIYKNLEEYNQLAGQPKYEYDFKKNLVITGGVGTGKTMYASWLAIQAIRNKMTVRYMYASDLAQKVKASWGSRELTEDDVINEFVNCDLLILDEIGRVEYNDYLFKVFDGRYNKSKPSIILGNIDAIEVPKILGEAIASRLRVNVKALSFGKEDKRLIK